MKILFLHGWRSVVGGVKPTHLKQVGFEVINPKLDDDHFELAVSIAQSQFDAHQPDVDSETLIANSGLSGVISVWAEPEQDYG
jgi:hypothetical protein